MPAYNPSATYHASITVPGGLEPRTASSAANPLMDLADNTKFLKDSLDVGISLLRAVGGLTDLAAEVATNNEVRLVADLPAIYRFIHSDPSTPDGFWVVAGVNGNWYRLNNDLTLANGGAGGDQIRLDPGKLATPNRIVSYTGTSSHGGTATATAAGVTIASVELPVVMGDILEIAGFIEVISNTGSETIRLGVFEDSNPLAIVAAIPDGSLFPIGFSARRVAASSSTKTYRLKAVSDASTSDFSFGGMQMNLLQIRPLCQKTTRQQPRTTLLSKHQLGGTPEWL